MCTTVLLYTRFLMNITPKKRLDLHVQHIHLSCMIFYVNILTKSATGIFDNLGPSD